MTAVLEALTRDECLDLLAGQTFGRLSVVVDGGPDIFPVNYVLDGDTIAVRTDPGTKLTAAGIRRVAFEVDDVDADSHTGWSVVVRGLGYDITEAIDDRSVRTRTLVLMPWAPGPKTQWIKILHTEISGRRLVPAESAATGADREGGADGT
jgi:nitroimidazol reductase NimA-like FMN-containing flavoprotein (pyridoxamine 5'-phosphate oxidase superfamily)